MEQQSAASVEPYVERFGRALLALDRMTARGILKHPAIRLAPIDRIDRIVVPALEQIGTKWEQGDIALSQVYLGGKLCEELVDLILPPADPARRDQPKIAIAVLEDVHLLGKRIVYMTLRASGFELLDYGPVQIPDLVTKVKNDHIKILLISTLMLPSALRIKEAGEQLRRAAPGIRIIVGGAPFRFDKELWKEVGADAVAMTAQDTVRLVKKFMGEQS